MAKTRTYLDANVILNAMDALHVAAAIKGKADELVTFEKPGKPFFRIPADELRIISLYPIV
jgi:predicted nucleic acid-binding protein